VLHMKSRYSLREKLEHTTNEICSGTPTENYFNATCGIPVNEYFWLNSLHPTYPMQDVLAEGVAAQLEAGPNIC
jgi:hypothetical protein